MPSTEPETFKQMDTQTACFGLLTAGTALGGVFFSFAHRRWPTLVSPYTKANQAKRDLAAFVDAWICAILFGLLVPPLGLPMALVLSPFYLLVRDRILPGQSLGKFLAGLLVIELDSGSPCGILCSVRRNVFFVVPGFNLVAMIIEARTIRRDSQGMRLGDRFARTHVVEGKALPELVKRLQNWVLAELGELEKRRLAREGEVEIETAKRNYPKGRIKEKE